MPKGNDIVIGSGRPNVTVMLTLACAGLALAACDSTRFGGRGGGSRQVDAGAAPIVGSVPSGTVTSEPLAPPPGSGFPGTGPSGGQPIASLPPGGPPAEPYLPAAPVAVTRNTAVGAWTARDATGTTCRVNLSSASSLDLYRASAGGCANKDLARVTAWDFRDGEVYLYQPGGAVAARLRPSGGELSGVLSKSGAPLTLTRG